MSSTSTSEDDSKKSSSDEDRSLSDPGYEADLSSDADENEKLLESRSSPPKISISGSSSQKRAAVNSAARGHSTSSSNANNTESVVLDPMWIRRMSPDSDVIYPEVGEASLKPVTEDIVSDFEASLPQMFQTDLETWPHENTDGINYDEGNTLSPVISSSMDEGSQHTSFIYDGNLDLQAILAEWDAPIRETLPEEDETEVIPEMSNSTEGPSNSAFATRKSKDEFPEEFLDLPSSAENHSSQVLNAPLDPAEAVANIPLPDQQACFDKNNLASCENIPEGEMSKAHEYEFPVEFLDLSSSDESNSGSVLNTPSDPAEVVANIPLPDQQACIDQNNPASCENIPEEGIWKAHQYEFPAEFLDISTSDESPIGPDQQASFDENNSADCETVPREEIPKNTGNEFPAEFQDLSSPDKSYSESPDSDSLDISEPTTGGSDLENTSRFESVQTPDSTSCREDKKCWETVRVEENQRIKLILRTNNSSSESTQSTRETAPSASSDSESSNSGSLTYEPTPKRSKPNLEDTSSTTRFEDFPFSDIESSTSCSSSFSENVPSSSLARDVGDWQNLKPNMPLEPAENNLDEDDLPATQSLSSGQTSNVSFETVQFASSQPSQERILQLEFEPVSEGRPRVNRVSYADKKSHPVGDPLIEEGGMWDFTQHLTNEDRHGEELIPEKGDPSKEEPSGKDTQRRISDDMDEETGGDQGILSENEGLLNRDVHTKKPAGREKINTLVHPMQESGNLFVTTELRTSSNQADSNYETIDDLRAILLPRKRVGRAKQRPKENDEESVLETTEQKSDDELDEKGSKARRNRQRGSRNKAVNETATPASGRLGEPKMDEKPKPGTFKDQDQSRNAPKALKKEETKRATSKDRQLKKEKDSRKGRHLY